MKPGMVIGCGPRAAQDIQTQGPGGTEIRQGQGAGLSRNSRDEGTLEANSFDFVDVLLMSLSLCVSIYGILIHIADQFHMYMYIYYIILYYIILYYTI